RAGRDGVASTEFRRLSSGKWVREIATVNPLNDPPGGYAADQGCLRFYHRGLKPRPLPLLRLAHDVHGLLGLVADPVDLDPGQLLPDHLAQLLELRPVLVRDLVEEVGEIVFLDRGPPGGVG